MKNLLYRIAAGAALLSCIFTVSCDEPETPQPEKPEVKIGTITPGKESAVVEVTLSKNAKSYSWAVVAKGTSVTDKDYTKVTDPKSDADGKVTINVTAPVGENTFYIFAENGDGKSAVAQKDFTVEAQPAPTVSIVSVAPGDKSAIATLKISADAESYSWACVAKGAEVKEENFKKVTEFTANDESHVTLELTELTVGEFDLHVFAENKNGKSATAKETFEILKAAAPTLIIESVTLGENSATAKLKISDNAESYSWACVAKGAEVKDEDYKQVADIVKGEDGFVTLELTELAAGAYDLYVFAENKNGKSYEDKESFSYGVWASIYDVNYSPTSLTAQIAVSEDITSISWAIVAKDAQVTDGDYKKIESPKINILGRVSITVDELTVDTEYDLYVFVESPAGKSEVVSQTVKTPALLVSYELKNITPISLDLSVDMLANCKAYCATVLSTEVYNEKDFTQSGKNSLDEESYYKPFEAHTQSAVLDNESMGDIILLPTVDNVAVKYLAAIYAVDNEGNGQVITSEPFTLPAAEFGKSEAAVSIELTPANTSVNVTYTPNSSTAKVIVNYTASMTSLEDPAKIKEYLREQIYGFVPEKRTTPWSKEVSPLSPGGEYFFYALAIDANGNFGDIVYVKGGPKEYTQDGKGTVTATLKEATQTSLSYNVAYGNGTVKARFVAVDPTSMAMFYKDEKTVFNTLCDDDMSAMWSEYSQDKLNASNGIITFDCPYEGSDYTLYAVTYDGEGKSSALINLGTEKTKPIEFEYGGIGEASIEVVSVTEDEYKARNITYKIVYGANTEAAYLFTAGWNESIDPEPYNPAEEGTAIAKGAERRFTLFPAENPNDEDDYYTVAVVTQDASGKFKKAAEKKFVYSDMEPTK